MESKNVVIAFILITLFGIAFISFGINFGEENSANINIGNDSRINELYSNLNNTIKNYEDEGSLQNVANDSIGVFDQDDTNEENIFTEYIGSALLFVSNLVLGFVSVASDAIFEPLLFVVLPNSPEIRSVLGIGITVIVMFSIIFLAIKLRKTGT